MLGEIWQIADTENRGLLTPPGFGIVLRLIGYAQAGRPVSANLALQPGGPLPKFDGIPGPSTPSSPSGTFAGPLRPQTSGGAGPIRVPPLTPDKVSQYSSLFEDSGAQNGVLSGDTAKQIFERAQLPNEVLGRIWNLADTEQKGSLSLTEFIIAMHLLASYKSGTLRALPQILPAGLYEAAARRGVSRQNTGRRPSLENVASAIPRQFSGAGFQRPSSPLARPPHTMPQSGTNAAGDGWAISPQEKAQFDQIFATVDTANRGYITGEQAVVFFGNSRLPEDALAQIWDLADINSEGKLNRDEFAVAMYLIKQQRTKRDGRDVLPQTLPPDLVPPSMRRQGTAPSQPTAPAFDNALNASAPKKPSEDLFGLDALSSPTSDPASPPLVSKPTGDSSNFSSPTPRSTQQQASTLPQVSQSQQPQQSSVFKPFIPSSSFGQTMRGVQPQVTGQSQSTSMSHPSAMDDLLGDNDPEVNKTLTNETTDLANLSNQVSNLTGQMHQVKSNRISTEQDLSQAQAQKRDFENRLVQLRAAYEQEVREVKALEDQLAATRNDIRKLQQEMAMISGSHQDLQKQHQQIAQALAHDQHENAALKEKIRQTNEEVKSLKQRLEKLMSDARQQKGLVAINKKQLATNEAEREKVQSSLDESKKEYDEATKELEESKRSLESRSASQGVSAVASPAAPVNSPAGASMNPFFRSRAPTGASEKGIASPFTPPNVASPNHNAFDSFFGPSAGPAPSSIGPPPTAFGSRTPGELREITQEPVLTGQSVQSSNGPGILTPSDSPSSTTFGNIPSVVGEPPAPPQSRQITSSFLPLRGNIQRADSTSSSVKVAPPASRMSDASGNETSSNREDSIVGNTDSKDALRGFSGDTGSQIVHPPRSSSISAANTPSPLHKTSDALQSPNQNSSPSPAPKQSGSREIPGAFPGDASPPAHTMPTRSESSDDAFHSTNTHPESSNATRSDPFSMGTEHPRTPVSAKQDFDAAFANFGSNGKAPEERNADARFDAFDGEPAPPKPQGEFPPIQEFGADDESDSDSDRGFDDDFTAASPRRKSQDPLETQRNYTPSSLQPTAPLSGSTLNIGDDSSGAARPPLTSNDTNTSQLPTPGAQQSPPSYDQITPAPGTTTGQRSDSASFPAEYKGLLPAREDFTSPATSPPVTSPAGGIVTSGNVEEGTNTIGGSRAAESGTFGSSYGDALSHIQSPMAPGASEAPFAYTHTPSQSRAPSHSQAAPQPQSISQVASPNQASQQPPIPAKTALDDFDNEFGDLSEAKEADDKTDDELTSSRKDNFDEFNPIFDSPATSRSAAPPSNSSFNDNNFHDFESSITGGQGYGPQQIIAQGGGQPASSNAAHDWDAIFAGLDKPQTSSIGTSPPANTNKQTFDTNTPQRTYFPPLGPSPSGPSSVSAPQGKPTLARVMSEGTEHDDPILKRLTGMGYPRDESLRALEKFDYNIDKVCLSHLWREVGLMNTGCGLSHIEFIMIIIWFSRLPLRNHNHRDFSAYAYSE